jgi:hypothetical protein
VARVVAEPPPKPSPITPPWVHLFALACGVIALLGAGEAFPTLLGVGGAACCVVVARNTRMERTTRAGLCAAIAAACWMALFLNVGWVRLILW